MATLGVVRRIEIAATNDPSLSQVRAELANANPLLEDSEITVTVELLIQTGDNPTWGQIQERVCDSLIQAFELPDSARARLRRAPPAGQQ